MTQGRLVMWAWPATTGPATPKAAESTSPAGLRQERADDLLEAGVVGTLKTSFHQRRAGSRLGGEEGQIRLRPADIAGEQRRLFAGHRPTLRG